MSMKRFRFTIQLVLTIVVCGFLVVPSFSPSWPGLRPIISKDWAAASPCAGSGSLESVPDTIFRSLLIGVTCLGVDLIIGVPAAYAIVKIENRFTRLIEELLVVPLAVPGLAIALALLISYGGWTGFRQSWLIILVGHVIFTLPFMIRSVIAILQSFPLIDYEEGAASLGAGFGNRFFRIVIPNAMPGILAGALMVFTLSIGEFNLTWMLHTPFTKTLPVGLADSYASMRLEIGSAYTIIFFIMIIPLLLAMQWVGRPRHKRLSVSSEVESMKSDSQNIIPGDIARTVPSESAAPEDGPTQRHVHNP